MADYTPDRETEGMGRGSGGLPLGLDPVSPTRFGEIIDADRDSRLHDLEDHPRPNAGPGAKRDRLSRATWVMVVVAGVVLGFAMAMIVAG